MIPGDDSRRSVVGLLVVTLVLLGAGCVALPTDGVSQAHLEERFAETDVPAAVHATVEVRETVDGETTTATEERWLRADGTSRVELVDDGTGMVIVNDGTARYYHDLESDSVNHYEIEPNATAVLEGVYAQPERYVEAYDVTAVEETTLDDREVYRVALEPPDGETIERSISVQLGQTEYVWPLETSEGEPLERSADRVELWLDRETMFPVKHLIAGDGIELETAYRDLEIDPELDDELFEPPASADNGAESGGDENGTDDGDGDGDADGGYSFPTITQYESVNDADAAVPFSVAEPGDGALPDGVELASVTGYEYHDEDRTQVTLVYRDAADASIMVTTSDGEREFAGGGDSVEIGASTGAVAETEQGTELQWRCGDLYHSVFASGEYADGTAVSVGESLPTDC